MDVGLFIGPSFFSVRQDYVTGLSFTPPNPLRLDTVTIPTGRGTAEDSPVGFNIGGNLTYVTPNVSGAFLLRFSKANADLDFDGATHSWKSATSRSEPAFVFGSESHRPAAPGRVIRV